MSSHKRFPRPVSICDEHSTAGAGRQPAFRHGFKLGKNSAAEFCRERPPWRSGAQRNATEGVPYSAIAGSLP